MENANPNVFAGLFLRNMKVVSVPPHYYDPRLKMTIDAETKVPLWLGTQTDCQRASGQKSAWSDYCTGYDSEGNCKNSVYKMDFYSDYDTVVDAF